MGTHKSSQISTPSVTASPSAEKRRSTPNGTVCAEDVDLPAAGGGRGGEPSALVKLLVIGDERFGDEAEQPAAVQDGGAVKHLIVHGQRQADQGDAAERIGAGSEQVFEGVQGAALQDGLLEQVGAGVAGQRQLREDQDGDALRLGPLHEGEDALGVEGAVGDAEHRRGGGDAEETVEKHGSLPLTGRPAYR